VVDARRAAGLASLHAMAEIASIVIGGRGGRGASA